MSCYTPCNPYPCCQPQCTPYPCCPNPCGSNFTIYWGNDPDAELNFKTTTIATPDPSLPPENQPKNYSTNSVFNIYPNNSPSANANGIQIINSNYWQTAEDLYVDNAFSWIQFKFNDSVNSTIYIESPHRPIDSRDWDNLKGTGKAKTRCMIMSGTGKYHDKKGYVDYDSLNRTAMFSFSN